MHRVLPVPGRLPRAAQPRDARTRSWARATWCAWPGWSCTRWIGPTGARYLKDEGNIGYCNITKCCTEVCPEHIKITDNAIIPLKERVVDASYDPLQAAWRAIAGTGRRSPGAKKPAAPRTGPAKVGEGAGDGDG